MSGQEERRQGQDDRQTGEDEADPTDHRSEAAPKTPAAVDRQLGGGRSGQEIGCRDAVFELVGGEPSPLLHAQPAEESDVGWGTAEPDDPDAAPLADDGPERDRWVEGLSHGLGHRMETRRGSRSALPTRGW
jgi:hypothetical protein